MIKYLGSKRVLVPAIVETIARLPRVRTIADLFSGTARVGHALKRAGYLVLSNDVTAYAACLARCYVEADRDRWLRDVERLVAELRTVRPVDGYFTETYCRRSRFFHPANGARIEGIREAIQKKALAPELESVLLVSLMEAADRVDSTTGVQMAYLKAWAARALKPLELRVPEMLPGPGFARNEDAVELAAKVEADVVYLDPPYNQHSYLGNYHVWETLVRWDQPDVYGVACKRLDCRSRPSAFNSRRSMRTALGEVIQRVRAKHLVVSFSDEGYLSRDEVAGLLRQRGPVDILEFDFKRYVGAQIGIYNPQGVKVGKVSHLRNREHLFVCSVNAGPKVRTSHGEVSRAT